MSALLLSILTDGSKAAQLTPRAWEQLLRDSPAGMLTAHLALQAANEGWIDQVPKHPWRHLEAARRVCISEQESVRWELDQIERALRDLGRPIVLLKGAAYLAHNLDAAAGRFFSDIDLLVPREALHAAEAALIGHGWISNVGGYDRRYYERWMHELPPLEHVQRESVIDLHHAITPPVSRTPVDTEKLLAAARPVAGTIFSVLAPADMVLHAAIHLFQEGEFGHGLRDLVDIDRLLREFGSDRVFWPTLLDRAAELRVGRPLYYAVWHCRALLATPMPDSFTAAVEAYRPSVISRRMMERLLRRALIGAPAGKPEREVTRARSFLYLRGHYMRMPLHLLLPHLLRKSGVRLASLVTRSSEQTIAVGGEGAA